jgi:hypothetical protein
VSLRLRKEKVALGISGGRERSGVARVGMETDWIHMESDSNITSYHIFTRIRIHIRMFSNMNTKRMSQIRIHIRRVCLDTNELAKLV